MTSKAQVPVAESKIPGKKNGISGLVLVLLLTLSLTLSAGCSEMRKSPDLHVYRTDADGIVLWNATIVTGYNQFAGDIAETAQHDLVIGTSRNFIARIDYGGNVSNKSVPGDDQLFSSIRTRDGGRLTTVDTVSKYSSLGLWKEWEAPISSPAIGIQLMNGNYIVGGHRNPNTVYTRVFCLAPDGSILWDHDATLIDENATTFDYSPITSLYESRDHVIEVTSATIPGERPRITGTTELDFLPDGTLLRVRNISAFDPLTRTSEGEYVFIAWPQTSGRGYTGQAPGIGIAHIVKLSHDETLLWNRELPGSDNDRPLSIIQTSDGGYAVLARKGR